MQITATLRPLSMIIHYNTNASANLSKAKWWLKTSTKLKFHPLVISAGMPRSASTLLFNIIREILAIKWGRSVSSGWTDEINELPKGNVYLIKTHHLERYYRIRANYSFYSFRDLRVAGISGMRRFGGTLCLEDFRDMVSQYKIAKAHCDQIIKYEDLISDPGQIIERIGKTLCIPVSPQEVIDKTFYLEPPAAWPGNKYGHSVETLMHENHFTYTKDDEWRSLLSEELKESIASEFAWWFEECGYPVT